MINRNWIDNGTMNRVRKRNLSSEINANNIANNAGGTSQRIAPPFSIIRIEIISKIRLRIKATIILILSLSIIEYFDLLLISHH